MASAHAGEFAAWETAAQTLQSAFKITNKQESTKRDQLMDTRSSAAQASASAEINLRNVDSVRRVMEEFGSTSQLVDPCYQVGMANTTVEAKGKTDESAQRAMSRIYTTDDSGRQSVGGVAGAFGSTKQVTSHAWGSDISKRTQRHLDRYCSVAESAAGYCSLNANGMQSADSDFSVHATAGKTFGWDQTEAATDFVKTIAPVQAMPHAPACRDASCRAVLAERRKNEAYMSMSRYSMVRFVESRSTQSTGDAKKALSAQ